MDPIVTLLQIKWKTEDWLIPDSRNILLSTHLPMDQTVAQRSSLVPYILVTFGAQNRRGVKQRRKGGWNKLPSVTESQFLKIVLSHQHIQNSSQAPLKYLMWTLNKDVLNTMSKCWDVSNFCPCIQLKVAYFRTTSCYAKFPL